MTELGVLGGTFNPPHLAHLACARAAHEQLGLERVTLMPVHTPPLKDAGEDPGVEHRLMMCRTLESEWLSVCELEARRGGVSYTAQTLRELRERGYEVTFILGADAAATLERWREPEQVRALARLAVCDRPGVAREEVEGPVRFLDAEPRAISSSEIRRRVHAGQAIEDLVPAPVAAYIQSEGLYR